MRLRNILIVVEDIEKSKKFYHDLFGLDVILDNEGNVILTEGLVLQEKTIWKNFLTSHDLIVNRIYYELNFSSIKKMDKDACCIYNRSCTDATSINSILVDSILLP